MIAASTLSLTKTCLTYSCPFSRMKTRPQKMLSAMFQGSCGRGCIPHAILWEGIDAFSHSWVVRRPGLLLSTHGRYAVEGMQLHSGTTRSCDRSQREKIDEGSYALRKTPTTFYCCEKKLGPGQHAKRIYPQQHEQLQQRLNAALAGAIRDSDDDDDVFAAETEESS